MKIKNIVNLLLYLLIVSCDGQSGQKNTKTKTRDKNDSSIIMKNSNENLKCGEVFFFDSAKKNLWKKIKIKNLDFDSINADNHLFFVENCSSIITSPDKSIFLLREVINDQIQDNYDYYEAPYVAFNINTQNYADYVGIVNKKIIFLSLTSSTADFINKHDFIFENIVYYLSNEFLKTMPILIKNNKLYFDINGIKEFIESEPLTNENVNYYNDIAYYLFEKKKIKESIFLLEKILQKFPDRVVAYLNLGDSYWSAGNKERAKEAYMKYISLMKSQNKDITKIPERVFQRSR